MVQTFIINWQYHIQPNQFIQTSEMECAKVPQTISQLTIRSPEEIKCSKLKHAYMELIISDFQTEITEKV
jgi:hypothetical protein